MKSMERHITIRELGFSGNEELQQEQHGMQLQPVMQSEHGQHHLAMRLMLLFLTMMVWECQCSMHGQKTAKFLHLDTMQTVMR